MGVRISLTSVNTAVWRNGKLATLIATVWSQVDIVRGLVPAMYPWSASSSLATAKTLGEVMKLLKIKEVLIEGVYLDGLKIDEIVNLIPPGTPHDNIRFEDSANYDYGEGRYNYDIVGDRWETNVEALERLAKKKNEREKKKKDKQDAIEALEAQLAKLKTNRRNK